MSLCYFLRGAGSPEVNGDYTQTTNVMDGVRTFSKTNEGADGVTKIYTICRSLSSKTKTKKWWICRTDRNGIEADIDFYTCESGSDTPPLSNWNPLKGASPIPSVSPTEPIVMVIGAGSKEVDGEYAKIAATMDGVPKYFRATVANGVRREYSICRSVSSKTKTKKWWLCRTDRNGIENDIDFYTCEDPSDFPPTEGWIVLKGEEPLPRMQYFAKAEAGKSADPPTQIKSAISQLSSASSAQGLSVLLFYAEASKDWLQLMLDSNLMPPLLKLFAQNVTNENLLKLLQALAAYQPGIPTMLRQGLLQALHGACEEWPNEGKMPPSNPITILSKLSVAEGTERPMVDAGLHASLLLAAEREDTRGSAFNALLNIAFAKDCKQALLDVGAIPVALKYGKDNPDSSAFKFLRSMALHPPAFPRLAEVGIVAVLKRNLARNYKDEQSVWFVSNLSDRKSVV